MKTRKLQQSLAAIAGTALICLASTILKSHPVHADSAPAKITIDYPLEASIFPPEITPPTFLWHDPTPSTTKWIVEITFAGQTKPLHIETPGPLLQMGTLDPQAGPGFNSHHSRPPPTPGAPTYPPGPSSSSTQSNLQQPSPSQTTPTQTPQPPSTSPPPPIP